MRPPPQYAKLTIASLSMMMALKHFCVATAFSSKLSQAVRYQRSAFCSCSCSSSCSKSIIRRSTKSVKLPFSTTQINSFVEKHSRSTRLMTSSTNANDGATKSKIPSVKDIDLVQDMLYRIRECNHVPLDIKSNLMDFVVEGKSVGKVTKSVAELLCGTGEIFIMEQSLIDEKAILTLSNKAGATLEARTDSVMSVMESLRNQGIIEGWRDELLPLANGFYDEPVLLVERAAAPFLGMQQYGVHINGIVKCDDGNEKMWMARRSNTKSKYPGMLDHIVAGGQPAGLSLMENVLKECAEEAGIEESITMECIRAAGAVSYEQFEPSNCDHYDGVVSRALLFNYELYLPRDFVPKVVDGEVEEFFTWTMAEVMESMKKDYEDPIKPNCYLVIIDFLLRKGYLSPEIPGYLHIMRELRGGYCG